jgi:hypothetical protein
MEGPLHTPRFRLDSSGKVNRWAQIRRRTPILPAVGGKAAKTSVALKELATADQGRLVR